MGAQETPAAPISNSKEPTLCEECHLNPSKYRCPGCSIRSCSLPCVKSHKKRTSCTGKRPRTEFVPLSKFDDNLLLSDYNLLEETKRVAEAAQRMRDGLFDKSYFKLPYMLRQLKNAANRRKTQLLFFPNGMSRRQRNQTRYNQRKKFISWTIEWRFHSTDSTDNMVLTDDGVDERTSLSTVIEKHLKLGSSNNQLKPFCEEQLDRLKFFIRKNPKGLKSPYRELDIKSPISVQLADITILEYPVIHVFLPSATFDFEVVKDLKPLQQKSEFEESVNNDLPSPKGVPFKEEQIEEDDDISMDPHILDLMNFMNSDPADSFRSSNNLKPLLAADAPTEDNNDFYSLDGLDFEQDLQDVYTGLLQEINPDGFLNLDGGLLNDDEELEEGEIPGF